MGRIDENMDTVKRCKMCLIPLGFKYARGIKDLCWDCGSTEHDADLRSQIEAIVKADPHGVACDYCGDIYCPDDIANRKLPDDTTIFSCWPCAADYAQQIEFERNFVEDRF